MMERTVEARLDIIRNGVKAGELEAISPPTILMNSSAQIKQSLTAAVKKNPDFNALSDEIRPVLILDGIEQPCGVFLPATVTEKYVADLNTFELEAYDRGWRVDTTLWLPSQKIAAGTLYLDAIEQLLVSAGIALVLKTPTAAVIGTDRTWEAGTSCLAIINELLAEINYDQLWFDENGFARLSPFVRASAENIAHVLDGSDVRSMILPEYTDELDIYAAANVFICVVSSPDREEPLVATAVNDNPASPLSVPRRGRRIHRYVKINDIASQEDLDAYAQRLCWESMAFGETISLSTALKTGWGVNDVVALKVSDRSGIYLSTGWKMELAAGGKMSHTLRRVVFQL